MKPCSNCGRCIRLITTLCPACYRYERKHGKARPHAPDGSRCIPALALQDHPFWKGDAAHANTKRNRARRRFQLPPLCTRCWQTPACDRHHRDGNTGNNEPSNIAMVCRRCHMQLDGRLDKLADIVRSRPDVPPKPCTNCGTPYKPLRKGLCAACSRYLSKNGTMRPYREDGRAAANKLRAGC